MIKSRLAYLVERYMNNAISTSEQEELSDFIEQSGNEALFSQVMMDLLDRAPQKDNDLKPYEDLADKALRAGRPTDHSSARTYNIGRWTAAAACVLLIVLAGVYFRHTSSPVQPRLVKKTNSTNELIVPGKNGAILTLADGSSVLLDSLGNGKVASQNGADLVISQGKLAYSTTGSTSGEIAYNTLSTPKGRQFHIKLPDGTEVWLNAASAIHYPTIFTGKDRTVELTGEAYFEVAGNPSMPFIVKVDQTAGIKVLGTHFNVNAYRNEPVMKTTLLEGSIQFHTGIEMAPGEQIVKLRPGQQSQLETSTRKLAIENDVETEKAVAWKNGIFNFNDASLQEVMNQLERWYDIEVAYENNISPIRFYGKMTKNIPLNDLLLILEKSQVHFKVVGRRLIVLP
ncbi:FecR domain-containing protein [Flavitalea sp. BT771]|uniref:FecR family protein n=1 Tax=Flavitalea sp. BT771 TaxID=3063329 RepID=UPI0026E18962|nr:FecR family protein [Flavitalea sp. BT771]MDO6432230.1 FecR domain-containing protein [Flavitalea sp. BT771]MDV6221140.1 FecR domain-containing protein [Flavitalea sp. BT771]